MKKTKSDAFVTLRVSFIPLLLVLLVLGTSQTLYQIRVSINEQIYGVPRGKIGEETPADLDLPYQEIQFKSENITLDGWFVDNENSQKAIILAPGRGANRWSFLPAVPFLYDHGYDVLLFDPRTTGLSEGRQYGFGYFESRDILNAVDYLRQEHETAKVGVLGGSAGATAALIAGLESDRIQAIVADSPYANLKMVVSSYASRGNSLSMKVLFPVYMAAARLILGVDIYAKTNVLSKIEQLKLPVFLIHGLSDKAVLPENSKRLYQKGGDNIKLWTPEGVGHVQAFKAFPQEYKQRVFQFFDQHLHTKNP